MKLFFLLVYMCVGSSNPDFYTKSSNHTFGPGNQLRCRKKVKKLHLKGSTKNFYSNNTDITRVRNFGFHKGNKILNAHYVSNQNKLKFLKIYKKKNILNNVGKFVKNHLHARYHCHRKSLTKTVKCHAVSTLSPS
jgi:hypothetical protein